jgi:hemerythrin-like metal-binding protein
MDIAIWQAEHETSNPAIDEQHQTLFQLINNLADAISRNENREVLQSLLDELIADTTTHFKFEENLVRSLRYPRFFIHRAGHQNILDALTKISKKFRADSSFLTVETARSIKDAIVKHMHEEDLPMVESLNLGIKAEITEVALTAIETSAI